MRLNNAVQPDAETCLRPKQTICVRQQDGPREAAMCVREQGGDTVGSVSQVCRSTLLKLQLHRTHGINAGCHASSIMADVKCYVDIGCTVWLADTPADAFWHHDDISLRV